MNLLKRLTQAVAPSGFEDAVRDIIIEEIKDYVDELEVDAMGNLIAHKKGTGKRIMLASHMDEIGVIATFIDDKGYIRFATIGWLPPFYLLYKRVKFTNGTVGIVGYEEKLDELKELKQKHLFIDIGAKSKQEAEALISIGDSAGLLGEFEVLGDRYSSKAMDNRAGCYCLINVAKTAVTSNDVYYVFTAQEEVGLRGAKTAAFKIEPEYALAVDVTDTGDTPDCKSVELSLGDGVAIKVKDNSIIAHKEVRERLFNLARKNDILYQIELMQEGGTDAGAIHTTKGGIKTGGLAIGTRYIHSNAELVDKNDLNGAIKLIKAFIEEDF